MIGTIEADPGILATYMPPEVSGPRHQGGGRGVEFTKSLAKAETDQDSRAASAGTDQRPDADASGAPQPEPNATSRNASEPASTGRLDPHTAHHSLAAIDEGVVDSNAETPGPALAQGSAPAASSSHQIASVPTDAAGTLSAGADTSSTMAGTFSAGGDISLNGPDKLSVRAGASPSDVTPTLDRGAETAQEMPSQSALRPRDPVIETQVAPAQKPEGPVATENAALPLPPVAPGKETSDIATRMQETDTPAIVNAPDAPRTDTPEQRSLSLPASGPDAAITLAGHSDRAFAPEAPVSMTQPVSPALAQATSPASPSPVIAPQGIVTASPSEIVTIMSQSLSAGEDRPERIVVQLDPPELGRVSIDFKFDAQGLQHVTITSETPEALRQLRLMHFELIQALERHGLAGQDMTFRQNEQQAHPEGAGASGEIDTDASADGPVVPQPVMLEARMTPLDSIGGGLNIRL